MPYVCAVVLPLYYRLAGAAYLHHCKVVYDVQHHSTGHNLVQQSGGPLHPIHCVDLVIAVAAQCVQWYHTEQCRYQQA